MTIGTLVRATRASMSVRRSVSLSIVCGSDLDGEGAITRARNAVTGASRPRAQGAARGVRSYVAPNERKDKA